MTLGVWLNQHLLLVKSTTKLRDELQEKQNEIDYFSDQNSELLTQVNNLEDELKKLKGTEVSRAQYEKRFRKFINDENVDN